MKIGKGILQTSKDRITDPPVVMMVYRPAPLGSNQPSPVEILHGHKAHSDLSIANAMLCGNGIVKDAPISTKT